MTRLLERLRRGKPTRDDIVGIVFVAVLIGVAAWQLFGSGPCDKAYDEGELSECLDYHYG